MAAACMLLAFYVGGGVAGLVLLFLAGLGLGSAQGAFWALPTALFTPATFAVGAVAINIGGSSGGLIVPHVIGVIRQHSGSFAVPTLVIAATMIAAAALVVFIRRTFFAAGLPTLRAS
jgi:ACS family tartrate transporter-like MFS transporter